MRRNKLVSNLAAERVLIIATAARVPIGEQSAKRVANAAAPAADRLSAANLMLPMEIEPASFRAAQQREVNR
jgi:hypothetical protein